MPKLCDERRNSYYKIKNVQGSMFDVQSSKLKVESSIMTETD